MLLPPDDRWTGFQKYFFRFFCCFFILYLFPFPLDQVPFVNEITAWKPKLTAWYSAIFEAYSNMWHSIVVWFAAHILHLKNPVTIFTNGSGDTTFDYIMLLINFLLALLASITWSVFDRKRSSYREAYYWIRVLVRYFLGMNMITYGMYKVLHLQMPFPYLSQLVQPFGDKSPMGLAWSFVGYSKAFSAFTGWGEVVGGLLLFFRKTTTLGALLSAVVMGNIVAINFCYDVPVKLFSSALFLMCLFLLAPDARRLLNVLWYNRPAEAANLEHALQKHWQRITRLVLKWMFILYTVYELLHTLTGYVKDYGDNRTLPTLYGIYNSTLFVKNHDTLPPLTTDTTRWKQLVIQFDKYAMVKTMDDSARNYNFEVDSAKRSISAWTNTDTLHKAHFVFKTDSTHLRLDGKWKDDSLHILFSKFDVRKFRLVNTGFRWINEYPFNR